MTRTMAAPVSSAQVEERRRQEKRATVDSLKGGQWLSVTGQVRTGHPIETDDMLRLTQPAVHGPECEVCGRDRWVAVTRVAARSRRGDENLADRLLCRACGHEIPDNRQED